MREQILYYALKHQGEYCQMARSIEQNKPWEKVHYEGNYITILDSAYPCELLELKNPPYILFYEGKLELLKREKITVVGSRTCTNYAADCLNHLIQHIDEEVVIVSGLAKGVDGKAHQMALKNNRESIGVIGCGLDVIYPKENEELYQQMKDKGLIISEYPFGSLPMAHHFPWRNRILAALSTKCYVISAKSKSGTMITADYALNLNREVIAFPHRFDDEFGQGCNELIEQGAGIFIK